MKKTKNLKTLFISVLAVLSIMFIFVGFAPRLIMADGEYQAKTVQQTTYSMVSGASVRLDSSDDTSGIRFAAELSKEDYMGLKVNTDYREVLFGIIIAPVDYAKANALTIENLFGEDAKYNWPEWDGEQWVNPEYDADKSTVINIHNTSMTASGEVYRIQGSITKIHQSNLIREFVGVGYIKATAIDGTVSYQIASASDNERSIATVATLAQAGIENKIHFGGYDDQIAASITENASLQALYGDKLDAKFPFKGTQIYNVNSVTDWVFTGATDVITLYDANFKEITFENTQDGLKLASATTTYGTGEHNFYAITATESYKIKMVGATDLISNYSELSTYVNKRSTATDSLNDYAVLTNDIDCGGQAVKRSSAVNYYGHFNGLGYAIKNYTSNSYGLFGGSLIQYPIIENLALYFTATASNSAALSTNAWVSGGGYPQIKNLYVNITCESNVASVCGLFSGTTKQSYKISNVIIDVGEVNIAYAYHSTSTNDAAITESYSIGAPTNALNVAKGGNKMDAYTETIAVNEKAFFTAYSSNICKANGFSEFWSINDGAILFGDEVVVDTAETKETLYKDADFEIDAQALLGETVKKVIVNGESVSVSDGKLSITIANYQVGNVNYVRIIGDTKVIVQPFVAVTKVVNSGAEFLSLLNGYYNKTTSAGDYVVLGQDITLPKSGSTEGVWSTDNNWNFESAHFNGLGYSIDCANVKFTGNGLFGDIRFSTIENVAIINATASSGKPIISNNAWAKTIIRNIYAECDYLGGDSVGLCGTGEMSALSNCIVKITNAGTGTNYALSKGCKTSVTNCYAIGGISTTTNLSSGDNTEVFATESAFYNVATQKITEALGYNSYWSIKADGVYFGDNLVIAK